MFDYLIRRLSLIPFTLFCIILVNFVIINLAPGDPVTVTELSSDGSATRSADAVFSSTDERYLQFRERYGLTLPILLNFWPWTSKATLEEDLEILTTKKASKDSTSELPVKEYNALKVYFGDRSKYVMPKLLAIIQDDKTPLENQIMAARFFMRGGSQSSFLGTNISLEEAKANTKIGNDNNLLRRLVIRKNDTPEEIKTKIKGLTDWYNENYIRYHYQPDTAEKISMLFLDTRFYRYMSRVLTLDFGTMRNDDDKTVISEVTKRFKYSLTLSILPMLLTFVLCQVFGFFMAYQHLRWQDHSLNFLFLILYALPIFVVAPFLIQEVAFNHHFPFTNEPIPISGFTSPDSIYNNLNSYQQLLDILKHICLPVIAVMYGGLAIQTRLSRTAVLEILKQDYIRTAFSQGISPLMVMIKHVGRNAGITITTSIAGSLGVVLGGSLIVETLFEIHGFGKFFYDAVLNRDYNVIMFSSFASSLLSLAGYLIADIAYTILDPRVDLGSGRK